MTTFVKICGLTDKAAVTAALDAGADAVGFVMFVPKSPRNIELRDVIQLAKPARRRAKVVIVTADATERELHDIVWRLEPDAVQLHGREGPSLVRQIRADLDRHLDADFRETMEIWKALSVSTHDDLTPAADFGAVDRLLLDAKPPRNADRTGGHGAAFDWTILQGWTAPKPWILSGGLTPATVAEAIRVTGATAVDVSSGVEASPGFKDLAKIRAFISAAKAARPSGAAA